MVLQNQSKMKIVSISPNGTWNSNDGNTFYKFQIQFDNGQSGTLFSKSQDAPHQVGEDINCTINERGTIKVERSGGGNWSRGGAAPRANDAERTASIVRQVALKAAVELSAAHAAAGKSIPTDNILDLAERFNAWLEKKEVKHEAHMAIRQAVEESPF